MRIDILSVTNFRGFGTRTFEFPRSLDAPAGGNGSFHVLIGQNGRGKTSALDAVAVAAASWLLGVRGQTSRHIQPDDVRVRVLEYGDTARVEKQTPVVVDARGVVMGKPMEWVRELEGKRTRWVHAKAIKSEAEEAVRRVQAGEGVTLPLLAYYGTGRLWLAPNDTQRQQAARYESNDSGMSMEVRETDEGEDLDEAFDSRLAGYRFSLDPRCSPRDLLRWLKFEQQLAVQDGRDSRQFQIVKEAIHRSVEGCSGVAYHLRLGLLLDIEGQPRLPFGALSDGQRNMVAMIGDLAYRAAQLNPHLGEQVLAQTPGIVLIDELDLHLHPKWQRHAVEDLRSIFPELQFITTTHSPFIVQTARAGELIPLDAQPVPETGNLGVEEIARGLMGVSRPEVSPRYQDMKAVAKGYLTELEEAAASPPDKLQAFLAKLAEGIAPYADNPAFQAFLELKREAKLGSRIGSTVDKVEKRQETES